MNRSIEHSFKSRIRSIAREKRIDPAQLWQNLVLERFLVRLSKSKFSPHFILKGGVLLAHYVELSRYTQDLDFLIHNLNNEVATLEQALLDVIQTPIDDGFEFSDLKVRDLPHPHMKYPGVQATMWSLFGKTRFQVKVDLGFGDLITPTKMTIPLTQGNNEALFESLIEVPCYPKEFIFAEKLETIIYRGADNSRMKDFHDLYVLIKSGQLEADKTKNVIQSVFEHRETKLSFPISFTIDVQNALQKYWTAHLRGLPSTHAMPKDLDEVINQINNWLTSNTKLSSR